MLFDFCSLKFSSFVQPQNNVILLSYIQYSTFELRLLLIITCSQSLYTICVSYHIRFLVLLILSLINTMRTRYQFRNLIGLLRSIKDIHERINRLHDGTEEPMLVSVHGHLGDSCCKMNSECSGIEFNVGNFCAALRRR